MPQPLTANVKPVVVIELGTTSVRMAVGQVDEAGRFQALDSLQQAVTLGKDAFTTGAIEQDSIEECVQALRSFRSVLQEYGISDDRQIRAIATSAVREATNRDAFLDRIYIATGLDVDVIDDAEISRYTYLAVRPVLEADPALKASTVLVAEVGGGSTETLLLSGGLLKTADSYRLGSLRLKKTLEEQRAPTVRLRRIMQTYIERTVDVLKQKIPNREDLSMLALGSDVRFAASQLQPDWDKKAAVRLSVSALSKLTDEIVQAPIDDLVRRHHLSFPDAETLAPGLLTHVHIAKALGLKTLVVASATLRDGILADMVHRGPWSDEFKKQIVNSAMDIGRKYRFDEAQAEQTADLARQLFRAFQKQHNLGERYELLLVIAALLHEIGNFVNNRSHHKHSMYLIIHSDIFGLSTRDQLLTALVARYHRRAMPKPVHEFYNTLDREDRVIVAKLAAILRIADALSKGPSREKRSIRVALDKKQVAISIEGSSDLMLEEHALQQKREMFEQVYGLKVVLGV